MKHDTSIYVVSVNPCPIHRYMIFYRYLSMKYLIGIHLIGVETMHP